MNKGKKPAIEKINKVKPIKIKDRGIMNKKNN